MKKFDPFISIIISVYNGSNYLVEAVNSALNQSYGNFEVLVVNDGSDDKGKTEEIALSYGDKIRYLSKKNGGVATALNLGIREMKGDYFSWLSHDDVYYPDKLSVQVDFLRGLENQLVAVYSNYDVIDAKGIKFHGQEMDHDLLTKKPLYGVLRGSINGCSLLIPKGFFNKHGLFDSKLKTTQDYALWFRMIRQEKFCHLPVALIQSRTHDLQDTKKHVEVNREANELWKFMMTSLTEREILECEKTAAEFYWKIYVFL
ncbi:glycosyltransferase, partial [Francisellaceae bacterium]|nr:glycosyltransferase [Francisellaceae bacterium]